MVCRGCGAKAQQRREAVACTFFVIQGGRSKEARLARLRQRGCEKVRFAMDRLGEDFPPRAQLCIRYCSDKQQQDLEFWNQVKHGSGDPFQAVVYV
jgi:hypothetical protein